jgi:DNA-binding GntR family transcriptional regulator
MTAGGRSPAVRPPLGLRREVLADGVYEAVKALIMDRHLAPGAKINMDALARDLEVSPTPVREALARLEADGLVTKRALAGYTTVPLLDAAGLTELFELRQLLEPAAARWAAEAIDRSAAAALAAMVSDVRKATRSLRGEDYNAYGLIVAHDTEFHEAIAAATGRPLLLQTLRRLHPHVQIYRLFYRQDVGRETLAEHAAIARCLREHDAEGAAAAMTDHLAKAHRRFLAGLAARA